jgi:hypothetical protein
MKNKEVTAPKIFHNTHGILFSLQAGHKKNRT